MILCRFFIIVGLLQMIAFGAQETIFPLIPSAWWQVEFLLYMKYWGAFAIVNFFMIIIALLLSTVKSEFDGEYGDIRVGDVITPKHDWSSYEDSYTDIHSLASAVHKESRK